MRLTTLILVISIMHLSAGGFAQRITLSTKHAKLQLVFKEIRKQSGYGIICEKALLEKAKPVTLSLKEATLEEALKSCFLGQPLTYRIENKIILVSEKIEQDKNTLVIPAGMNIDIRGKVLDENSHPLQGATVKVRGSNLGVMTDKEGDFFLKGVPDDAVLVIAYLGYKTLELKAMASMGLIKLQQNSEELQEVVINKGYYETTRELNTGSTGRVDATTIQKQPVLNPMAAIAGRITGVTVQQTTGTPGGAFKIEIRGRNNLRNEGNEPLYIVDGVPFSSESTSSASTTNGILSGGVSPLNVINNADIESIDILKDADATAIYGSRGANGVILITTKKGKPGKTKFGLDVYQGAGKTMMQPMLNTEEYLAIRKQAFINDGITQYPAEAYDVNGTWDQSRNTDWQKEMIGDIAHSTSIQSSVSGGNEGTLFLFSAGYRREGSVQLGDFAFTKGSSHLSLNHITPDKKITLSVAVTANVDKNDQPRASLGIRAYGMSPNSPALYDENGDFNWAGGTWDRGQHPLVYLRQPYNNRTSSLVSNMILGYQIIPGLRIKSSFGFTQVQGKETALIPSTSNDPALQLTSKNSSVSVTDGNNRSWIIEPQISFDRKIGPGDLSVFIGTSFQQQKLDRTSDEYVDFPSNSVLDNLSLAARKYSNEFTRNIYRYGAAFGRLNYNVQQKYILNFTGRRDASSRFGPGKQFASFGAIGAAWIFSKEKWLKDLSWLSFGKIRGSYGSTGNDQIGNYEYLDTYSSGLQYQGIIGLNPSRLYNPDFSWEVNKKLEAAVELGFLNDRINLSLAWYRNRSSNQLINYTLPLTTGFNGIRANFPATVQNTGVEIDLNTVNYQKNHFNWTSSFNISLPDNKLLEFPNFESSTYANSYVIGQSIYIKKFYEVLGVDPASGYYTFKDYNGDGKISSPDDDRKALVIGQKFFGGFNNSLVYKNWSLDIFFQYVKQLGYNYNYGIAGLYPGTFANFPKVILEEDRWQKPGDVSKAQRLATEYNQEAYSGSFIYQLSDGVVGDASYIRCKNIMLAYSLPEKMMKGRALRFYLQAQNLFVITAYKGYDPETQRGTLPPLKMATAGLQLSL